MEQYVFREALAPFILCGKKDAPHTGQDTAGKALALFLHDGEQKSGVF